MSKKDFNELALKMHEEKLGKVSIQSKVGVSTKDDYQQLILQELLLHA